jgi:subtilase family serine protease
VPSATPTLPPPTNTLTLTPVPPTPTATPGPADLVVTSIIGPNPVTLGSGNTPTTATFSVTITNTGQSQASPQFTTTLEVQGTGIVIPIGVVANLLPGESIILTGDVTFSSAGTATVIARTDSLSQITEISEANNLATLQVTVNANP